jgi:hypothetical protein
MSEDVPTSWPVEVPYSVWTGRLEFDLMGERGWRVAIVEIVVRIESVTLWCGNRTLAVLDREAFREWLIHPRQELVMDDVAWSVRDSDTWITVDGSVAYLVPEATVRHLVAVI